MSVLVSLRSQSLGRVFTQALALCLLPLATASAQSEQSSGFPLSYGFVQVTRESTDIDCFGPTQEVCMTATKGTILELLYIDGDRYEHKRSNWYWVLLPPDQYGNKLTGWVRGSAVEHIPPPQNARGLKPTVSEAAPTLEARIEPRDEPAPAPMATAPAARPVIADVVVNFEFNKSALTDEARRKLDAAVVGPTSNVQAIAVELEGHADWIGREAYNERLGLARAESVKRYMTEHLGIPADRISVFSFGETDPVAPNTTREGRAQNRRVVIKGGGSSRTTAP